MSTEAERKTLFRLAEAVADRQPVDWKEEGEKNSELAGKITWLRVLDSIGATQRELEEEETVVLTPRPRPEVGAKDPTQWGGLQVLERIGRGSFGDVYRAHDPTLQWDVALKLQRFAHSGSEIGENRFLNEARKLARVRHPNVLVVHGVERHDDRLGLWTELLAGKTLEECLDRQGPFGPNEVIPIGIDLCRALAAVHREGLIHGDVKTANVMREQGGRIVLLDFSSVICRAPFGVPEESEAESAGTPAFMAPELFSGATPDARSDLYSLGVVLYRLVSGRFPFEAKNLAELQDRLDKAECVPLLDVRPDLPPAFVQVVERALSPDREQRYATAGEMERSLAALIPGSEALREKPIARRLHWLWAAAAMLVVVAGLAIGRGVLIPEFEVEATLYRLTETGEERLHPGVSVQPGDPLFLEIEGTRTMYVYVVNQDSNGKAFVLFPLAELDAKNPLPADLTHRLPGSELSWGVSSVGGTETLLIVASRQRLPEVEQRLERIPKATSNEPLDFVDLELLPKLRGIGGLVPRSRDEERDASAAASDLAGAVVIQAANDAGVWVWEVTLNNPTESIGDS